MATRWRWPPESAAGFAIEESLESERDRHLVHAAHPVRLGHLAQSKAEGEVLPHAHVRVERIVLEHHGHVAVAFKRAGDIALAEQHPAVGHLLEPRDEAQERRLPASGRPDQDHELAVGDLEVDAVDGRVPSGNTFATRSSRMPGHQRLPASPRGRPNAVRSSTPPSGVTR
jgi:hypothetical protein